MKPKTILKLGGIQISKFSFLNNFGFFYTSKIFSLTIINFIGVYKKRTKIIIKPITKNNIVLCIDFTHYLDHLLHHFVTKSKRKMYLLTVTAWNKCLENLLILQKHYRHIQLHSAKAASVFLLKNDSNVILSFLFIYPSFFFLIFNVLYIISG